MSRPGPSDSTKGYADERFCVAIDIENSTNSIAAVGVGIGGDPEVAHIGPRPRIGFEAASKSSSRFPSAGKLAEVGSSLMWAGALSRQTRRVRRE
jgi:hypothetical protein